MNEQRQALLDALGEARLPGGTIAWPVVVLVVVAVLLLAVLGILWLRRVRRQRQHRAAALAWLPEARAALAQLEGRAERLPEDDAERQRDWLAEAARLARRVALVSEARDAIAPLHGEAWLQCLDGLVGRALFSEAPVNALATAPYRPASVVPRSTLSATSAALTTLIQAVEQRATAGEHAAGSDGASA